MNAFQIGRQMDRCRQAVVVVGGVVSGCCNRMCGLVNGGNGVVGAGAYSDLDQRNS